MYSITDHGIIKKLETWNIIIPLHDNDGIKFPEGKIDEILEFISTNYPGFTIVSCIGFWKDQKQVYKDDNYQIIVDTISSDSDDSTLFFSNLKSELSKSLNQEKIYVTKTNDKKELLSFSEFFNEIGLEVDFKDDSKEQNQNLAKQIISSKEFIDKRLGYETVVLQRDLASKKIIWERNICGLRLKSEFEDIYPIESVIIAADQIDILGDALFAGKLIIIIGKYEFHKYSLEKFKYKPIVEARLGEIKDEKTFLDRDGVLITTKKFIELFSMSVFCNYLALREENYLSSEIEINVGSNGSMQTGKSHSNGNCLLHSPAVITDKATQIEIIRCIDESISLFESNNTDSIALLQAKARNNYINNRAAIRKQIKNHKTK